MTDARSRTSRARPRSRRQLVGAAAGALALVMVGVSPAAADDADALVEVVSERFPATGPTGQLGALRPADVVDAARTGGQPADAAQPNPWVEVATMTGVVKDVDFATAKIGYAAAELGAIWKTTDGGDTWTRIVNRGFPLYFYGVEALSRDEVVVSGFDNAASSVVIWRTTDGGVTWDESIEIAGNWGGRVRFGDKQHGLVTGLLGSGTFATATGGETADEWEPATADPDQGWIASQFTLLRDERAYLSGIAYCESTTGGMDWACQRSVDDVFDGPVHVRGKGRGWVGGGTISPTVEGWVHRTKDGGDTWSDRTLQGDWPVRHIESISPRLVWAGAGDAFSGNGGLYVSTDGGKTWEVDLTTGEEMTVCDHREVQGGDVTRVWCVGYASAGGWSSTVYQLDVPATTS